jgi:hypothetical protein
MIKNMGKIDKLIRLILAAAILISAFFGMPQDITGIIFLAFAGIFAITGVVGTCPLYVPFKFSTLNI